MSFIHHLERGPAPLTLLLLHGTGGHERQLLEVGRQVAPTASLLGVRGRSLEEGFPRFFRRFTATTYDQPHLRAEAAALAHFVGMAAQEYGLDASRVVALGYSNGANIGLAMLAHHPQVLAGAALLRPVMPLDDPPQADLSGKPVLLLHGQRDPYAAHATPVAPYLTRLGALVEAHTVNAGHDLSPADLTLTAQWLRACGLDA